MNNIGIGYFIAIVQEGNLNKAAKRLFVSQPSLSQYLQRLEKNLGAKLFDRSTTPLSLTYAGQRYYEYAIRTRTAEDNIKKELLDIEQSKGGCIKLGIPFWRGACVLPQVLPAFHKKYPNITFNLTERRAQLLIEALKEDKIDLAVMNIPAVFDYSNIVYEVLLRERLLLAVSTNNKFVQQILKNAPLSNGYPSVGMDILQKIPLIISTIGQNATAAINHALLKNHSEPKILLETANLTTAINLVAENMGCTFVPETGVKICQRPGSVIYLSINIPELIWPLAVVYRKDAYLPKICQLFIDSLKVSLKRCEKVQQ